MTAVADKIFREVEGDNAECMSLLCPACGNVIKKRRDSFLPGAHMVICILCHTTSPDIELLDGQVIQRKPDDYKQPTDLKK